MQDLNHPHGMESHAPTRSRLNVRSYLDAHAPELAALLAGAKSSGVQLARRSAEVMDALLCALYRAATEANDPAAPVMLAAVGGYGRRLLGWKSDLDVRLLTDAEPEQIAPLAEAILYPLWDAGVSVGHQVVTIDSLIEDARSDLPTATALLDFRPLAGDIALAHALNERMYEELFAPHALALFLERVQAELRARRLRLNDASHLLEPEVKHGAGGLRDFDCALWAAGARWKIGDPAELCRSGLLSGREFETAQAALDRLWSVRNRLHRDAGRKSDRLTFAEQERIAAELGYAALAGVPADSPDPEAVEAMAAAFMSDYHRHARGLAEVSERLLGRSFPPAAQPARGPEMPPGLCRYGDTLGLLDDARLEREPALALQLVAAAVARQLPLHAPSRESIQRACASQDFVAALRASQDALALFVALVTQIELARFRGESILAELQELGLLTALIPEFAPVISKAHHDTYHVYTVDVHSVYAVDFLRALARGEDAGECPLASRLAQEPQGRSELLLAAWLHDIGKARPGPGHARRGAEMAREILLRLQLAPESIERICLLIREHLSLYSLAMHRDLTDCHTIAGFARLVGDRRALAQLYLLTIADVRTTSPSSMTQWKNHMLDEAYLAIEAYFERGASMLPRLCPTPPDEACTHARAAPEAGDGFVRVACVPSRLDAIAELCVTTLITVVREDRPGLLALIAAALAANRLEVCAAEIHTRRVHDGSALGVDRFWVRAPSSDASRLAARIATVERDLERLLRGEISARALVEARKPSRWGERAAPDVPTRVIIDHDASRDFTVIEVWTKDQPGLLFTLAETLTGLGLSVALAKISTEGARATDAFYVSEHDGSKLARGARAREVERTLLSALTFHATPEARPCSPD